MKKLNLLIGSIFTLAAFLVLLYSLQNKPTTAVLPASMIIPSATSTPSAKLNIYPKSEFTTGDTFNVTKEQICVKGYSGSVRDVTVTTKKKVYEEYGLNYPQAAGAYEVDHFIPLELGGSNDIQNLWPEPANPAPGFHEKDVVENYLHSKVCKGELDLTDAQNEIKTDWYQVYQEISNPRDFSYQ